MAKFWRALAALLAVALASPALAEPPYIIVQVQPTAHVFELCGEWFCATWLPDDRGAFACVIHIASSLSPGYRAEIETEMRAACIQATLAGAP